MLAFDTDSGQMPGDKTVGGGDDAFNTFFSETGADLGMKVHRSNLEGLLQKHVEMAAEIKNLDTDLQMLVYENYNKFISATDTIKRYVPIMLLSLSLFGCHCLIFLLGALQDEK